MQPHQKHYRAKMKRFGFMDEAGKMAWPPDIKRREEMARTLFGWELASNLDYWLLLADDALDDTYKAPWSSPERKPLPVELERRAALKTLSAEQREAVRELLRDTAKGQLHSFCVAMDQTLGGATISVKPPALPSEEVLEIHSASHDEMHTDVYKWLEDFSILFGKDERYES